MHQIADVSVIGAGFSRVLTAVTLVTVLTVSAGLVWSARRGSDQEKCEISREESGLVRGFLRARRLGRQALKVGAVLLCQLLAVGLVAARVNSAIVFVTTLGQAANLLLPGGQEQDAVLSPVTPAPLPAAGTMPDPRDVLTPVPQEDGYGAATVTGWRSGASGQVRVWTPPGYAPDDGRTYHVLVLLHGQPGTPESVSEGYATAQRLQAAVQDGTIPPTIVVVPSLNLDDQQWHEPDCADVEGHAQTGTWLAQDVPAMITATYPNVSRDRSHWGVGGNSSGAYCALWTALSHSEVFGAAISMSGYDIPVVGGMRTTAQLRRENTLSTLIATRDHQPLRFWVLGALDDPSSTDLGRTLVQAAPAADSVTSVSLASGSHSWTLWNTWFPYALAWFGGATDPVLTGQSQSVEGDQVGPVPWWRRGIDSFTTIRGSGLLVLSWAAVILATVLVLRAPGWLAGPRRRGTQAFLCAWAVRLGALGVCSLLGALALGLTLNSWGEFYSSWEVASLDLLPSLVTGH